MPRSDGYFRPGPDPRRHDLTTEERRRGYDTACKRHGLKFATWLRSRVADTATPQNVARYKAQWLARRTAREAS
jgi:DNA-binding LacI/PurR family transcriptional regulator